MAQIRKFLPGGQLSLNGKTYSAEQINEYLNHADLSSQERAALAGTVNAIASGQQRTLDRNANTLSGDGVYGDFKNFYGGDANKAEKNYNRSTRWANRQARKESDYHIANTAISKLGGIEDYFLKKEEDARLKAKQDNILHKLNDSDGFYTTNADGTVSFIEGPDNLNNQLRINRILDALNAENLDGYNLTPWGDDKTLSGLTGWWAQASNDIRNQYTKEAFWDRIKKNNLSNLDKEVLTKMGMSFGVSSSDPNKITMLENATNKDAASKRGLSFKKNSNGRWTIDGDNEFTKSTWFGRGLDFLSGTAFENGAIHNGVLYTADELKNGYGDLSSVFQPWMDNTGMDANNMFNYAQWYDNANNTGIRFVGDKIWDNQVGNDNYFGGFVYYNPNEYYSEVLERGGVPFQRSYFKDVTDYYNTGNFKDARVMAYVSKNEDEFGVPKIMYRASWIGDDGKVTYQDYSSDDLSNFGFTKKVISGYQPSPRKIERYAWETIDGKKYYSLPTRYAGNIIMKDRDGNYYVKKQLKDGKNKALKVKDVAGLLDIIEGRVQPTQQNVDKVLKFGGVIRPLPTKFQFGGNVQAAKNQVIVRPTTENEATSISQTHKIDKEKGAMKSIKEDFSRAEKAQLAAAIGDLAGVAMTFVPVYGNIAGAVTGLAATGTQLWADIKKDGFQWGDLGSAGLSALMDVGTLIPGAGTAAKIGKVTKSLKAVAKPVMKLLTIAGAVNGVKSMSKVINGEDVTSEDIVNIFRGISSTTIGAKMVKDKIGDVKLSKKLEDAVVHVKNDGVSTKPSAEIGGKKITIDDIDQINGKTKEDVEKFLKSKVKDTLGADFDEAKHGKDLSEKFGIEYDKGEFDGLQWKNLFKGKDFIGRKAGKASWTPEAPMEGHSLLRHWVDPRLRNQTLGYDYGWFGSKKGYLSEGVGKTFYDNAYNRVQAGQGTLEDHALLRQGLWNPEMFSFGFENNPTRWLDFSGSRWIPSYRKSVEVPQIPTISSVGQLALPAPSTRDLRVFRAYQRHNMPVDPRVYLKKGGCVKRKKVTKHEETSIMPGGRSTNLMYWTNPTTGKFERNPYYADNKPKKIATPGLTYDLGVDTTPEWKKFNPITIDFDKTTGKFDTSWAAKTSPYSQNTFDLFSGKTVSNPDFKSYSMSPVADDQNSTTTKPEITGVSFGDGKRTNRNFGAGLMGLTKIGAELGTTFSGLNRQENFANANRNIAKSIESPNVTEFYESVNDGGKRAIYEQAALQAENQASQDVTSDPIRNRLFKKMGSAEARMARLQGQLAGAENESAIKQRNLARRADYAAKRVANLKEKMLRDANADASYNTEMSKSVAVKTDAIKKATQDLFGMYGKSKLMGLNEEYINASREYQDWYDKENAKYDAGVANGTIDASKNPTFTTYLKNNDKLKTAHRNWQDDLSGISSNAVWYRKKGGNVRPTSEQIKIDTEKAKQKAIAQLSKQSFALLKKALS